LKLSTYLITDLFNLNQLAFVSVSLHANQSQNTCRLFEDIANYERMIEQLNNDKKKMNVKVHAADTYLTQVKELESAYRFEPSCLL
jgi:hypothetical protein